MVLSLINRVALILTIVFLQIFCVTGFAQDTGVVRGVITDSDGQSLIGANVVLEGTILGASTDFDGVYVITNVPAGTYTVMADYVGYQSSTASANVSAGGTATVNFTLDQDVLDLQAVVTTGSVNPVTKIESSVAITTLSSEEIRKQAPRNTAELLNAVPGFYVESSGGEGGNNLFARGIPADGSFRYVQMQEDGLPLFEDGELMFANVDVFMRVDESIKTMEGVRGSTGSIFASNSPGGIINFISKTGGNSLGGLIKTSVGDYGLYRTDLSYGGPLGDMWRFHIGGFYRYDEGIRDPGFPANVGGQLKANLTRLMDNGYVRLYLKYLNDRNTFYLPIPLQDKDNPEEIPGFDANYGTLTTFDVNYIRVPKPGGGFSERYLEEGMHPKLNALGAEIYFDLGNDWALKNMMRNTNIGHTFNAIFSLSDPSFADTYAEGRLPAGATDYRYSYVRSGETISNPLSLNGNGLVANVGWWGVDMDMRNFVNHLQLTKSLDKVNVTLGGYFSDYKAASVWFWHDVLVEVADHPRLLNLEALDGNGDVVTSITDNGFTRYGNTYNNFQILTRVTAGYLDAEFQANEQLRIDGGVRVERQRSRGHVESTAGYDLGDPNTLADDNVTFGTGEYQTFDQTYDEVAVSVGGNYSLNQSMAFYARGSSGYRVPDDNQIFFNLGSETVVTEDILQFEGGIKYASPNLGLFGAFFYNTFDNIPFSDEVVNPDGSISTSNRFAGSKTWGLELEAIARFGQFGLNLTGTYQDPKYSDFGDNTDNQVRRIPKLYATITPSFNQGPVTIFASARHYGERYTDDANTGILPAFTEFNAGLTYRLSNRFTVGANGSNLTNTIGLTEGNPRVDSQTDPRNFFFMARPILGRSFTGSLTINL